jgi:hypothetical protein
MTPELGPGAKVIANAYEPTGRSRLGRLTKAKYGSADRNQAGGHTHEVSASSRPPPVWGRGVHRRRRVARRVWGLG